MQGIKEIIETWENMKFPIQVYAKGTETRGFILGSVEEILEILDDNNVNLQSILGSRFVGPFLSSAQKWERTLSLIGEVTEVGGKCWTKYLMFIIYNPSFLLYFCFL